MTDKREEKEEALLYGALAGDTAAIDLCQRLFRVSQVIDDLVDNDRPVSTKDMRMAFWDMLIEIPANGFYQKHFTYLHPIIAASFLDWNDATALETGTMHDRTMAFVLRDTIGQIIIHCALLIGGIHHATKWSIRVRRHIMNETLENYLSELKQ